MKCCNRIQPAPGVAPEAISRRYEAALQGEEGGIVAATGGARFARYEPRAGVSPSPEMLESSFGCGDPVAFSGLRHGQTVLDLGSGGGLDLVLAAARVGPSGTVIGVDLSDAMIERARSNARAAGWENIELRRGAIEALPVESASVDWVISNCVINLSPDKDLVFREIYRVLRPGGRVLVSDIVAESLPFWVRRSGLLTVACVAGAIPESDYLAGMAAAGLTDPEIRGRMHYSAGQMAEVVVESLPSWTVALFGWLVRPLLTWLATPVAGKLWSVRVAAYKDVAAYKNEGGEART